MKWLAPSLGARGKEFMALAITAIHSLQEIEVAVNGPDAVRRMFIVTGIGEVLLNAKAPSGSAGDHAKQTFTALVGPQLAGGQFVRGLATASLARVGFGTDPLGPVGNLEWGVDAVDADFEDEAGRTELRISASVVAGGATASILRIAFQVTILATA